MLLIISKLKMFFYFTLPVYYIFKDKIPLEYYVIIYTIVLSFDLYLRIGENMSSMTDYYNLFDYLKKHDYDIEENFKSMHNHNITFIVIIAINLIIGALLGSYFLFVANSLMLTLLVVANSRFVYAQQVYLENEALGKEKQ